MNLMIAKWQTDLEDVFAALNAEQNITTEIEEMFL